MQKMKTQKSVGVRQKAQQQIWLMIQNFRMEIEHLVMWTLVVQTAVRTSISQETR
jgi:hypothetical protein